MSSLPAVRTHASPSRPASEWKRFHPDASYHAAPGFELFNFDAIPPETGAGVLLGASPDAFPYRVHVTQPTGDGAFVHVDALVADVAPTPQSR